MKQKLLSIINNDTSYNKNATRYLHKTHPDLWKEILEKTSFLPQDAKPKQRVWHILNDIWEIPKCPESGLPVRWHENRYFLASSASLRTTFLNKTGKLRNQTSEAKEKRRESVIKSLPTRKPYTPKTPEEKAQIRLKIKQTFLDKYGYDNPSKHPDIRKKISDIQVANGATPKHLRSNRDLYYASVAYFTKKSWVEHFDEINPQRLNRSDYHLDHIYSIHEGFKNNIPPYIVGHWTNLRIVDHATNESKGSRCDKSLAELYHDVFDK